ncbi:hypothetical protein [Allomesorhizobium alhagi]|uniref:Uncharacterized protein n=1 Tax=Mesorhizobium alhagi CCNWXJ12-2 TaxID=1107882 RepID=H0HR53_9HYPH|nr:hypothetical protein [Mesorhizobium alhagi]EHK56787.1 hypothetical protein MAXJ12_13181 [Mesorhizobium alhagi CCNWXJ12-2]
MTERDTQGLESKYDDQTEILTVIVDRKIIDDKGSMDKLLEIVQKRLGNPEVRGVLIFPRKGS